MIGQHLTHVASKASSIPLVQPCVSLHVLTHSLVTHLLVLVVDRQLERGPAQHVCAIDVEVSVLQQHETHVLHVSRLGGRQQLLLAQPRLKHEQNQVKSDPS